MNRNLRGRETEMEGRGGGADSSPDLLCVATAFLMLIWGEGDISNQKANEKKSRK